METTLDPTLSPSAPTLTVRARWGGRVLTAVPVMFLSFDVAMKLANHPKPNGHTLGADSREDDHALVVAKVIFAIEAESWRRAW